MNRKLISDVHSAATRAEDVNDVGKSGAREEMLQKENEVCIDECYYTVPVIIIH